MDVPKNNFRVTLFLLKDMKTQRLQEDTLSDRKSMNETGQPSLRASLGLFDAAAVSAGAIIGGGIFVAGIATKNLGNENA